jgi:hypothetical protein
MIILLIPKKLFYFWYCLIKCCEYNISKFLTFFLRKMSISLQLVCVKAALLVTGILLVCCWCDLNFKHTRRRRRASNCGALQLN